MYRILIVEDDRGIAESIREQANMWGFTAKCAAKFSNIMEEFAAFDPQLVLLDISLPFYNGYHWCAEIRKVSKVPVIFISSASDNMNIVMAMNMGADDYITKPFGSMELLARVHSNLRRYEQILQLKKAASASQKETEEAHTLTAGGLELDLYTKQLTLLPFSLLIP